MSRTRIYLLVMIAVVAISLCALAQTKSESNKNTRERLQKTELPGWTWTKEQWTGDDAPFIKIRTNIDSVIEHTPKQSLSALVKKYEAVAVKQPKDVKAQFAWGYAAVQARRAGYDFSDRQWGTALNVSFNLAEGPSPHSYQYDRLRYLVAMWWKDFPQLKDLGIRLLSRNPDDYDVKFYQVRILSSGNDKEQQQAIAYANDLVRMQPKRPSAYSALGGAYYWFFNGNQDASIADKAIAAYRKYLELVPANAKTRPQAESMIKLIQEQKAKGKGWWTKKK